MRVQDNTFALAGRRFTGVSERRRRSSDLPVDGMPLVPEDPALIAAQRCRATRAVAAASHDAADCALLLDALGLHPSEGKVQVNGR